MRKTKLLVTCCLTASLICGVLTACGNTATEEPAATETITDTTIEAPTEAEITRITTENDASETDSEATNTEAEKDVEFSDMDEDGNVITILQDNDTYVSVSAKVFPDNWYVDTNYKTMGKAQFYNVPTKEDAYSNSPRIQVVIQDQETIDYYSDTRENVTEIDSITIGDVEYTGTTYTQYGMNWTEYKAAIDGTEEFMVIQISDVDTTSGEGKDVLNSITFSNVTSDHMQGEE